MVSVQRKFVPPWNGQYSGKVFSALERSVFNKFCSTLQWSVIQINYVPSLNGQYSDKFCYFCNKAKIVLSCIQIYIVATRRVSIIHIFVKRNPLNYRNNYYLGHAMRKRVLGTCNREGRDQTG